MFGWVGWLIIIVSKAQSRPFSHLGHGKGISWKKPCQGQLYGLDSFLLHISGYYAKFKYDFYFSVFFQYLACSCNSKGSTKSDDGVCIAKCCNNDGSCKCITGYSGTDCNICDIGFYVSATTSGEKTCKGDQLIMNLNDLVNL